MVRAHLRWLPAWALSAGLAAIAAHLKHPLLYGLRPLETPALIALAAAGLVLLRRCWRRAPATGRRIGLIVPAMLLVLTLGLTGYGEARFRWQRQQVLAGGPVLERLGRHFVVGFRDFASVRPLAEGGLIGGIYLSRRNLRGTTVDRLRAEIADLQARRRRAGLPPLIVAADQEGGNVAHLTPLLETMPALASVLDGPAAGVAARARAYGERQGAALADLGVNLNLAPVVDLKPGQPPGWSDRHTRIGERAIATDPETVARVAAAYSQGLRHGGVQPTVKHFPGLGAVRGDTHLTKVRLDLPLAALQRQWLPFRAVTRHTGAAIMLSHVLVPALDRQRPASLSRAIADDLLRRQWGFRGLLLTDDLNMGAVYGEGVDRAATAALDAGVDLILVAYDPDQYYRALHGAAQAWRRGAIDAGREVASGERLTRFGAGLAAEVPDHQLLQKE